MPIPARPRTLPMAVLAFLAAACGGDGAPPHGAGPEAAAAAEALPAVPPPGVLGQEACVDSGYLCPGLAERDVPRVLRWSAETREIRVHVPLPPLEPRNLARALQDAAVLGILAWQGQPFPLRVQRNPAGEDADIVVRWVEELGARQLGRAETEWSRGADGRTGMRVRSFTLAMRNPFEPARPLEPVEVQLTAAHEMGHALGLPHSDSPRDVMYPTNTATSLSPRDYETMAGLYRVENGAVLDAEALAGIR